MRFLKNRAVASLATTLTLVIGLAAAVQAQDNAITATVTGSDQQVGVRASVMKQAIKYNLSGLAENSPNNIVQFTLQGDKGRIDSALASIRQGTKRSSDIKIAIKPFAVDPSANSFTIVDWTSSSRNITNKYTLVYPLRANSAVLSAKDVNAEWQSILKNTLSPEDLKKLGPDN